jgi:DNA modification methylase
MVLICRSLSREPRYKLTAVCPYYTMFPLEFPLTILKQVPAHSIVFDPFCGKGTTNYAAQTLRIASYGYDSSPIAVAIAKAKLTVTDSTEVLSLMNRLLERESPSLGS